MSEYINAYHAKSVDSKNNSNSDESVGQEVSFQETLISTMQNVATESDENVASELNEYLNAISKDKLNLDNEEDFTGFVKNLNSITNLI